MVSLSPFSRISVLKQFSWSNGKSFGVSWSVCLILLSTEKQTGAGEMLGFSAGVRACAS